MTPIQSSHSSSSTDISAITDLDQKVTLSYSAFSTGLPNDFKPYLTKWEISL